MLSLLLLIHLAGPEEPARPDKVEWADGLGGGLALILYTAWGAAFDFFCSLPLLLGVSGAIERALQVPHGPTRRKQFFGAVARWQAWPGVAAAAWLGLVGRSLGAAFMLLCLVLLYLLVTLVVAWWLYDYWLADHYEVG